MSVSYCPPKEEKRQQQELIVIGNIVVRKQLKRNVQKEDSRLEEY